MILVVEMRRIYVVAAVPMHIGQTTIVCLILHNCFSSDAITIFVLVLTVTKLIGLLGTLCSERRLP